MCRYPSSSAQRTALTVVGPLGTCHTPRPRSGIWLPSASTRTRASVVFEVVVFEVVDIGCFLGLLGEVQDESASQAAAPESAVGFSRLFGWQHLRDAQRQLASFGKVANLFETSCVTGHRVCNERVNGNIPLAGRGPAARPCRERTVTVGPHRRFLHFSDGQRIAATSAQAWAAHRVQLRRRYGDIHRSGLNAARRARPAKARA